MKKKRNFFSRFIGQTMVLANAAVIAWLLLCYLSSFTSPASLKFIALFSLTTPFAIIANIVFVFIWFFSLKKFRSLLSIVALAVCWKMLPAIFGYHYFSEDDWAKKENSFKLMSWNVHAMGTFNSPHEKAHAMGIMELIRQESPDILCMPEFATTADTPRNALAQKIIKEGGYAAYQFNMDNGYGPKIWIGTGVFSRYPIVRYKANELSPYIYLVECDIAIGESVIRVGVVHLRSFGLSDQDKAIIEEAKADQSSETIAKSKSFAWKFNDAYSLRAAEAEKAKAILSQSPYPVIICGDFNDLPFSYTYTTMKGSLTDAFAEKGTGFGRTYNQIIPTLRIDHIFYDKKSIQLNAFNTLYSKLSDHSPVVANFEIVNNPAQ